MTTTLMGQSFGALREATHNTRLESQEIGTLRALVDEHRVLVLRGFDPLSSDQFEAYAQGWGEILQWPFGSILNVVVDPAAKNYLFTCGSVPHHWDGAFADRVPGLQIFQCLASQPNSGGETVFCDTTRIWQQATAEQREYWSKITVTYETEKLAHYGGETRAALVSTHPISQETTLRFAEPPDQDTAPLNPLSLRVEGGNLEDLLAGLRPLLYSPQFCYTHSWQPGDFLIADNHALLHARRPFHAHVARHLQRIHII